MLCLISLARAEVTREQAKELLLAAAGGAAIDREMAVYLTSEPLEAGASIEPFINEGDPVVLTEATWFGWIDDNPSAFFSHRTRFVFIRVSDGAVTVVNQEWWPEVDEEPPFAEDETDADPSLIVQSTRHEVEPEAGE